MKQLLIISFILFSSLVFCQDKTDFTAIDQKARSIRTTDAESLAKQLTDGYTTDQQKVRAIFRWVTENIEYKTSEYSRHPVPRPRAKKEANDTAALKPLDQRVADNVLENGTAVCDGYSRLFKALCNYAGLRAEIIFGYARGSKGMRRFGCNHSWNVVFVDYKWELMDVTWASGYISARGGEFVKEFDENYFMPPPAAFIEEHYPDDLQWTLMDDPPLMAEFRNSPYKQKTFTKYRIRSYSPSKGLLEVAEGDTLHFELESSDVERDRNIFSDLFPDKSIFKTSASILLSPSAIINNKTNYIYHVTSPEIKWLYLLYNDDVVLRYRIHVRKEKSLADIR